MLCVLSPAVFQDFLKKTAKKQYKYNSVASDTIQLYPVAETKAAHLVYKRTDNTINSAAPDSLPSLLMGKENQLDCIWLGWMLAQV